MGEVMSNKHLIAHIVFEAKTALKVGSSNYDFLQDSPIMRDWNGLPMILGTSLAGVLRKSMVEFLKNCGKEDLGEANEVFGDSCQKGSKVIFTNALLLDNQNKVYENLLLEKTDFLKLFNILPKRQNTAITEKGVAKDKSKRDNEVVFAGTRFKFGIEMLCETSEDEERFFLLLDLLNLPTFRIGSGSSKGFGAIKILKISYDEFEVNSKRYVEFANSLNGTQELKREYRPQECKFEKYDMYELHLKAENFFIFGSGGCDDEVDCVGSYEMVLCYQEENLSEKSKRILIPASSIKGAISHRTTYYYNMANNEDAKEVREIFGSEGELEGAKGKILMSDLYLTNNENQKIFAHNKIDSFRGGVINGALFQEKVESVNEEFKIEIWVERNIKQEAIKAFENALRDVANGMLALGGLGNKGHGFFSGKVLKNGVEI